jgi:hypothetical protein
MDGIDANTVTSGENGDFTMTGSCNDSMIRKLIK